MAHDELYHWGIKGQKWGVRRYRNEDGTLTDAGKKRYHLNTYNTRMREYYKKTDKKRVKNMSDEELDRETNRLAKEKRYKELEYDNLSTGDKFVHEVLQKSGKLIATGAAIYVGKIAVEKVFGVKDASQFIKLPKK